jgi:hypothetical protein
MGITGFQPEEGLNELEKPLAALRPVTGNLSRDRMLFEAGRARALTVSRGRMLMLALANVVLVGGLAISLFHERSQRHALELAFAVQVHTPTAPPTDSIPPVWIASNDGSPYSYRALSLLQSSSEPDEWRPATGAGQSDGTRPGAESEMVPLRVRDTTKLLQF